MLQCYIPYQGMASSLVHPCNILIILQIASATSIKFGRFVQRFIWIILNQKGSGQARSPWYYVTARGLRIFFNDGCSRLPYYPVQQRIKDTGQTSWLGLNISRSQISNMESIHPDSLHFRTICNQSCKKLYFAHIVTSNNKHFKK